MNDSRILAPNGAPVGHLELVTVTVGGQQLTHYRNPGVARQVDPRLTMSQPLESVLGMFAEQVERVLGMLAEQGRDHDLCVHSLLREVVTLRARIEALEAPAAADPAGSAN